MQTRKQELWDILQMLTSRLCGADASRFAVRLRGTDGEGEMKLGICCVVLVQDSGERSFVPTAQSWVFDGGKGCDVATDVLFWINIISLQISIQHQPKHDQFHGHLPRRALAISRKPPSMPAISGTSLPGLAYPPSNLKQQTRADENRQRGDCWGWRINRRLAETRPLTSPWPTRATVNERAKERLGARRAGQ